MTSGLRKLVFFGLLVGVAVAGYQYMIKPANKHLAETKNRVATKLNKLDEFEQATAAAKYQSQQLEQLHEAIQFFESKLPPKSKIHEVLEQVTVIAQTEGLEPKTIRTLERTDNSGYIEQPLEMALAGDFKSFYSFLLELEKLPRIMKIRELEIDKEKTEEGRIVADFVVSIFFQHKTT
mgnify:FL=1